MSDEAELEIGRSLHEHVLTPLKEAFVGKDEVIDLLGVTLVARENLFILGPPGTAKSALVQELTRRLHGRAFDYLLTRFTEPNELFGPFDIRRLREGDLVTNTEGMLPEAEMVFLDELLNANSAILNSLLLVLNERVFRRGRETRSLPTLMVVGASNRLPEDEALQALFDRFLLRVRCDNVAGEELTSVLEAGWKLDTQGLQSGAGVSVEDVRRLQQTISRVDVTTIRTTYVDIVHRIRHAGVEISDRRAVKLQRLIAASALLCGRLVAHPSDLWVLRYVWDTEEQADVLESILDECRTDLRDGTLTADAGDDGTGDAEAVAVHPRSRGGQTPDAEHLAEDLERLERRLDAGLDATNRNYLRDQLGLLASRCQWVTDPQQHEFLESRLEALWDRLQRVEPEVAQAARQDVHVIDDEESQP